MRVIDMRLIDADELINQGYEIVVDGWQYDTCNKSIDIDTIPTAYSVDKVVEELEGAMRLTTNDDGETNNLSIQVVSFEDAIEIVKHGGIRKESDMYGNR